MSRNVPRVILIFCIVGIAFAMAMLITAAVGTIMGSTGPAIPTPYLILWAVLDVVLGIPAALIAIDITREWQ